MATDVIEHLLIAARLVHTNPELRLGVFTSHLGKVGKALEQAARAHNQAVGSLESRVLVTARKFDGLGIAGEVAEPEQVATVPRLPAGHLGAPLPELDDAA